jgi:hypothetical protein
MNDSTPKTHTDTKSIDVWTNLEKNKKRYESSIELPNKATNSDGSELLLNVLTDDWRRFDFHQYYKRNQSL